MGFGNLQRSDDTSFSLSYYRVVVVRSVGCSLESPIICLHAIASWIILHSQCVLDNVVACHNSRRTIKLHPKTRDNVNHIVQCDAQMDHICVTADNGVDVLSQPRVWVWYFFVIRPTFDKRVQGPDTICYTHVRKWKKPCSKRWAPSTRTSRTRTKLGLVVGRECVNSCP